MRLSLSTATPRLAAARAILTQPSPWITPDAVQRALRPTVETEPLTAWRDYLHARGWLSPRFLSAEVADQLAAIQLLSTSLTFPLTLARQLATLAPQQAAYRLCVVGSRAESTLPVQIWSELACLTGMKELHVSFCGPKAAPPGVPLEREWRSPDGALHMRLSVPSEGTADLFHRGALGRALGRALLNGTSLDSGLEATLPDAFVLFNPGTGEPGWRKAWAPTLHALRAARRPMLMTALSVGDAARDDEFIRSSLEAPAAAALCETPYERNPFGSLAVAEACDGRGAANYCAKVVSRSTERELSGSRA